MYWYTDFFEIFFLKFLEDNDPASMQRLVTVLGTQLLVLCEHLVGQVCQY